MGGHTIISAHLSPHAFLHAIHPHSSALQVVAVDSDSMPLVDPLELFEIPAYQQHGNLFWPDRSGPVSACCPYLLHGSAQSGPAG